MASSLSLSSANRNTDQRATGQEDANMSNTHLGRYQPFLWYFCLAWQDPKIPSGNHQTSDLWNLAFIASVMDWPNTLPMKCSLPGFNTDLQIDSASMGGEVWWAGEHKRQCTKHEALLLLTEDSSAGSLILSLLLISDAHLILRPRQVSIWHCPLCCSSFLLVFSRWSTAAL